MAAVNLELPLALGWFLLLVGAQSNQTTSASAESTALATARSYVQAQLDRNPGAMVDLWAEDYISLYGGRAFAERELQRRLNAAAPAGEALPMRIELGPPVVTPGLNFMVAFVPAEVTVKGFPRDVTTKNVYPLVSDDNGQSWRIIELICRPEEWGRTRPGRIFMAGEPDLS